MNAAILSLADHPTVAPALARNEKEFFGQGFSHYPKSFRRVAGGVAYALSVYNTPRHTQVNWNVRDARADRYDYGRGVALLFALTPEESRALAAELGLPLGDWLAAALEACRTDVTPTSAALGSVVEPAAFHAGRAGDDQ